MVNNCIILSCYITLEKDKDIKKKRNDLTPPATPVPTTTSSQQMQSLLASIDRPRFDSVSSSATDYYDQYNLTTSINFTGINTSSSAYTLSKLDANNNNMQSNVQISGGAKKVNVEVIMKSNPFRVGKKGTRLLKKRRRLSILASFLF